MFGISVSELAIILLILVVVIGPEKLPEISKKAAKLFYKLNKLTEGARKELYNAIYEPINEIKSELEDEDSLIDNQEKRDEDKE